MVTRQQVNETEKILTLRKVYLVTFIFGMSLLPIQYEIEGLDKAYTTI